MFCGYCGSSNDDTALTCIKCGSALNVVQPPGPPQAAPPVTGQPSAQGLPPNPNIGSYTCVVCGYILAPFENTCSRCKTPRGMGINPNASIPGSVAPMAGYQQTNNSGTGEPVPAQLQGGWNWGAFFFSWIWGLNHKTYITLIALGLGILSGILRAAFGIGTGTMNTPAATGGAGAFNGFMGIIQFGVSIWFGVKGNEWAWSNRRFESVEHFRQVQRTWAWWALGFTIAMVILCGIGIVLAIAAFSAVGTGIR